MSQPAAYDDVAARRCNITAVPQETTATAAVPCHVIVKLNTTIMTFVSVQRKASATPSTIFIFTINHSVVRSSTTAAIRAIILSKYNYILSARLHFTM